MKGNGTGRGRRLSRAEPRRCEDNHDLSDLRDATSTRRRSTHSPNSILLIHATLHYAFVASALGWRDIFDGSSVGAASIASYATAARHWRAFINQVGIYDLTNPTLKPDLPVDTVEDILAAFVGYCLESTTCAASAKTILGYVNGVRQYHAAHRIFLPRSKDRWARTVSGIHRYAGTHHPTTPAPKRRPITPGNIRSMTASAKGTRDARWFPVACEFMFAAFLRKCETFPRRPSQFDPVHDPTVGDLVFTVNGVIVRGHDATWDLIGATRRGRRGTRRPADRVPEHLVYRAKHTKHCGPASNHARYDNVAIALVDDNRAAHLNGVLEMYRLCAERNDGPHPLTPDSPLFVYDGSATPASADQFNKLIKHHLAQAGQPTIGRSSHSMRHGAASHAIICGVDPAAVRRLGRWVPNSTAIDGYIHTALADARKRAASTDFEAPTPTYIKNIVDNAHLSPVPPRPSAA